VIYWYFFQNVAVVFHGKTMGTTYSIKAYIPRYVDENEVSSKIINRLDVINQSMSTYIKDSEISRFNKLNSTNDFKISDDFLIVMKQADNLYKLTHGLFDASIYPLVNLWGFTRDKDLEKAPSDTEIQKVMAYVNFNKIQIKDNNIIQKINPNLKIDLSSIAKGYSVDEISKILNSYSSQSYFVEIGGEIYVKGKKEDGNPWVVGIHSPNINDAKNKIFHSLQLENKAIATSGNYRNYIKIKSHKYGHIINPKTGYPTNSPIVSISVIADSTMLADGLATSFMMMKVNQILQISNSIKGVEVYIIEKINNSFKITTSNNFPKKIQSQQK